MNIPLSVARGQGHHGIKGKEHGAKGGRPRLPLSEPEREARRRQQKRASRSRRKMALERREPEPKRNTPLPMAKVGRNDPCPCGSGKKLKKCCGA